MYNFPYEAAGNAGYRGSGHHPRRHGLARMVLTAVAVGIVASLLLGPAFWALGVAFHLVSALVRLALLGAVALFVWHRIRRRIGARSGM